MGGGPGSFVKFNNADIYEVIHTLGRTAGINYLIDPRVRGVVNVHTQGVVRRTGRSTCSSPSSASTAPRRSRRAISTISSR